MVSLSTSQVSIVLLMLLSALTFNRTICCNEKDERALLMFKEGVVDPSNRLSNWSTHQHCCAWPGVTCDYYGARVIKLKLQNQCQMDSKALRGKINLTSLLQLEFLRHLDLSYNNFEGISIRMPSISNSNLVYLDLSFNSHLHIDNLNWLSPLSSLDFLVLNGIDLHMQTHWFQSLASLPFLTFLSMKDCKLTNINLSVNDSAVAFSHPPAIFPKLKSLDLSFNYQLHMDNLHWLSSLSYLENLDLSGIDLHEQTNWLQSMASLPSLLELILKDCNLTNIHPFEKKVNLGTLVHLDLADNNFNTEIPNWLFNVSNYISTINLSHSNFIGQIPHWLGQFHHPVYLDLSNNLLYGSIPSSLANISIGGTLDISFNDLSGNLPKSFENNLDSFDLSHNSLSGDLSNFLLNSSFVVMAFNKFEGGLPHLSNKVRILDLAHNAFSGSLSPLLCHAENNHENVLKYLDISDNFLTGEIPDCWNNWKNLSSIHLGSNKLTGEVPARIGSLLELHSLDLNNNDLFGHIPCSFQHSTTLVVINLERNNFSGSIANWMPQNISIVKLRSNHFAGKIPSQLCFLSNLIVLDIANNKFSGLIPRCLYNLTSLVTSILNNGLDLYEVSIAGNSRVVSYTFRMMLYTKGQRLEYSKNLRFVRSIDLSANKLSGELPPQLFQLIKLQSLNLSYNYLTGKVPDQIGGMKDMESLDLSHNKFHGKIPPTISSLSFLSYLNLSYNNFNGQIPLGTQLQSFNASSFIGNPELCGPPLMKNCPNPEKQNQKQLDEEDEDDIFLKSSYLGMGVGFAVGFWIVSGSLFLNRAWRHTFFRFVDSVVDRIYVIVVIKFRSCH